MEATLDEVLMDVFDDLVPFEMVSGHQSVEMTHGAVQHSSVLGALLFPPPIMQTPSQGFLDDHAHLNDFGLLKQPPQCVAVGVQASANQEFGDEQGAAKIASDDVGDVFEHGSVGGA